MMYLCMGLEAGGRQGFQFPRSAILKYGFNKNYGPKYIDELCDKGFIELVSSGRTTRTPNEYRFVFNWKADQQATIPLLN